MNRTLSLLPLVLLSSPAASQTRVRPMGEFRADAKGVSFVAAFEARSSGKFVMEVNQRIDAASVFSSSHCTVAADGVAGWADSTTALVNQDLSRPQAPEKIEYEGPELPSADCVIRVDRTIHASGSQYSLAVLSRALERYPSAAATVTQAQALAFIGKLRGTATVTLAMSTVAPGSPTNPNVAVDATPAPTSVDQPYFEFQVEKQATPRPGNAQPPYPDMLKSANVEGEVVAQFVVDTTGRVEMSTFKVLKSSHDLFTTSVKSTLVNMRFDPAEIAGRKVRQIVQMPFVFSLKK
jgi:TonB family protein